MSPQEMRDAVPAERDGAEAGLPADRCLHQLAEEQARRAPDAPALCWDGGSLTRRALDERANRLARHLVRLGAGPEARVGICLERGPELVVAILGVLKAGGAYVPLDPAHPAGRLQRMLADSGAALVITEEPLRGILPVPAGVAVLGVDRDRERIAAERAGPPAVEVDPRNLAYVIFTSGSTGVPKGIAVEHRGVASNLADWNRRFRVGPDDRSLFVSSPGFDISVFETLGVLAAGGAVVVPAPAEAREPARWAALMRRHGVTVWNSATALLGMLADHLDRHPEDAPPALRLAFVGGDWVPLPLAGRLRAHLPGVRVVAMGGVTEVSIYSVLHEVGELDPAWKTVPYGVPMAGQRAWVLDERLDPVPAGAAGEMYIGGVGVARGYVGRPGFTAERFLPDPYASEPGARMYRTGDRARWREYAGAKVRECESTPVASESERAHALAHSRTSVLEFLGRLDHQVKIRGNRVEPGEVEAVLRLHPRVARCAVAAREDASGEKRLVAYVVGEADTDALREHLRRSLPEYMVPAAFVFLDRLPLSPNGKVDRAALPAPEHRPPARPYLAPRTPMEEVLAEIWTRVLPVGRVGALDDFFDLGGESGLVTRLIVQVEAALGVALTFRAVLARPTLEGMAEEIERMLYEEIAAMPETRAEELAQTAPGAGGMR